MPLRRLAALTVVLLLVFTGPPARAHSEMDKPLFVATDGVDEGRCQDVAAPCRTIGYALERVGKGGQIRIAQGRYDVENDADLFHLVSGIVNVRGGFRKADDFREPTATATALTGVPLRYRSMLASRGFHVIADGKARGIDGIDAGGRGGEAVDGVDAGGKNGNGSYGIDAGGRNGDKVAATEALLAQYERMQAQLQSAPCVGGEVEGLPCEATELLAHVPFSAVSATPGAAADVWGFVDLNTNREYAIVGFNTGTGVFDITDAENPREVGYIDGQSAVWRDIKVHQHFDSSERRWKAYAYVTTDGASDGLFVIDLTGLPHRIDRLSYTSDFSLAHNVFAAGTDFGTGLPATPGAPALVIAGSNNGAGRFRLYSLADPRSPAFVSIPPGDSNDYMHDAASMIIRDARKDTQCVNAVDYCEVLFDFSESTVDIWDITVPSNPVRLSQTPYANAGYTHSGWPSEDGQTLFVHDELDEQSFGLQTTLRAFSLANLAAPSPVGSWNGPTTAIDHNGFVRGNRYYMSNYSRGLTILDISNPAVPQSVGLLDTYPFSDAAGFVGAWGAYPYFHSGNIAISDISSGLYVVGDRTLSTPAGQLSFEQASFAGTEGDAIEISVQRTGGASGAVSVSIDSVGATSADAAALGTIGTLNWADGDAATKSISLATVDDGSADGLERRLVRLVAPTGGASLAPAATASVYVGDPGDSAVVAFDRSAVDVTERGIGRAIVTVQRRGSAVGAASVDYALSGGDATEGADFTAASGASSGTLAWADGDADPKSIEFDIADDGADEADEFFELSLSSPAGAALGGVAVTRVNILEALNQAPNAIAGSSQTVGIGTVVTLTGTASNDPDGDTLSFRWQQTMGPAVTLGGADTATATFTAPDVASDTLLRFSLEVTDSAGLTDVATATVTVTTGSSGFLGSGGGGGAAGWLLFLLAGGAALRRAIRTGDVSRSSVPGRGRSK